MMNLPDKSLLPWYEKIADIVVAQYQKKQSARPFLLAVSGPQGSGKSTLSEQLPYLLYTRHGLHADGFSLDDVYMTRLERESLAQTVHPLLKTRGVPGTHNLSLAEETLQNLKTGQGDIPRFDKGKDDRCNKTEWRQVKNANDIVIVEGWCMGCPPQPDEALQTAINELEKNDDSNAIWRRFVNTKLKNEYAVFFNKFDYLIWLQPPSFEQVFTWRSLQEKKLKVKFPNAPEIMDDMQLRRFISHYERLTRHMLQVMPNLANVTVLLRDNHEIHAISESLTRHF